VHEAWQKRGIAVALLKALDKQPWMNKKILKLTSFSLMGRERLSNVIFRELKAKNYIVLPEDYCWINLPTEAGVWDAPRCRYSPILDT
jgi:hypothetical protein